MLLDLLEKFPSFKVTFSISGVALEQFEAYAPEVVSSFRALADTGRVEFLGETYFHSLAYFINEQEFIDQVRMHREKIYDAFGVYPAVFRNTELIYSDGIGSTVADLGFRGVYIDGVERILEGRTPNALYRHPNRSLVLFPRHYQLSDDIAFRYADPAWSESPLQGATFAQWVGSALRQEQFISLAMDYETFGEHKKADTGIFSFFEEFVRDVIRAGEIRFVNPSDVTGILGDYPVLSSVRVISWADEARDLSAWLGNDLQRDAFHSLYKFHEAIVDGDARELLNIYRYLQTSDHFYYMSTKKGSDGNVHQYFSPFKSPYEAFMNFMNVMTDLELRVEALAKRRNNPMPETTKPEAVIVERS
jgi:alpha-amylase